MPRLIATVDFGQDVHQPLGPTTDSPSPGPPGTEGELRKRFDVREDLARVTPGGRGLVRRQDGELAPMCSLHHLVDERHGLRKLLVHFGEFLGGLILLRLLARRECFADVLDARGGLARLRLGLKLWSGLDFFDGRGFLFPLWPHVRNYGGALCRHHNGKGFALLGHQDAAIVDSFLPHKVIAEMPANQVDVRLADVRADLVVDRECDVSTALVLFALPEAPGHRLGGNLLHRPDALHKSHNIVLPALVDPPPVLRRHLGLHDKGAVGVPFPVFRQPDRAVEGREFVQQIGDLRQSDGVRLHLHRWDGLLFGLNLRFRLRFRFGLRFRFRCKLRFRGGFRGQLRLGLGVCLPVGLRPRRQALAQLLEPPRDTFLA